jgi:hypothetical protein
MPAAGERLLLAGGERGREVRLPARGQPLI